MNRFVDTTLDFIQVLPEEPKPRDSEKKTSFFANLEARFQAGIAALRHAIFNESQARDEYGRWIGEGGFISSPSDAINDLSNGDIATVNKEDVRQVVLKAIDAPGPIDLTNLSVEGTPLFVGGLNRSRDTMPQIPKEHQERFLTSLKDQGIKVTETTIAPSKLLPTQNEIDAGRVGEKIQKYDTTDKTLRPIMTSRDNYVLDGHHRWAVEVITDFERPRDNIKMPIIRIGADHEKALDLMLAYTKKAGIKNRALASKRSDTALHSTADQHEPSLTVAFRLAFLMGRRALGRQMPDVDAAVAAVRKSLSATLPKSLHRVLVAGGNTTLGGLQKKLRAAGDVSGHEFHGNQWTAGGSGSDVAKTVAVFVDRKGAKEDVNSRLRDSPDLLSDAAYEHVDAMDAIMKHSVTEKDMTVYRVMPDELGHLTAGDTFVDKGFVSASKSLPDLERVKEDIHHDGPTITLVINVPKGSHAIDVNKVLGTHKFAHQNEVLLDRRQTFRVDEVKRNDETDQHEYHVTLVQKKLRTLAARKRVGPLEMSFDMKNEAAVSWADKHAGELIDGISETTREQISNAVAEAIEQGDLKGAYNEILDAVGDEARASLIARTEVMRAVSEGQRQAWGQAIDKGLLTGNERRVWIATGDACPICAELDGEEADMDDDYPGEGGEGPPQHPNCRCTESLSVV